MHLLSIKLSDEAYAAYVARANEEGYDCAEDFIAALLDSDANDDVMSRLFSADRLKVIDQSVEQADRRELFTLSEVEVEMAEIRDKWRKENAS